MIETCVGSGVLVWRGTERAVVLTVHHLFHNRGTKIRVVFPNGEEYRVEQVQSESDPDLGALTIPRPNVEPMVISEDSPAKPGDRVYLCGFDGETGNYRVTPGVVKGYSSHRTSSGFTPEHDLAVIGGAVEGNSGGPIVDENGELVAIIWGTDGQMTYGSYANRIGTFLTSQKFVAPWGDTDKIAPWNAKTEREKIKAAAGAYAPPPAPVVPVAPVVGGMDMVARQMAQDALNQIEMITPELLEAKGQLDTLMAASGQSGSRGMAAEKKAEEAVKIAEAASTGIATLQDGLDEKVKGFVKPFVIGLLQKVSLFGGFGVTAVGGIVVFFLIRFIKKDRREYQTGADPSLLQSAALWTPWTWDDALANTVTGWVYGPPNAKPPGVPANAVPAVPNAVPVQPTIVNLQAQIDALKSAK